MRITAKQQKVPWVPALFLLLLPLLFLKSQPVRAQRYCYTQYTLKDGLAGESIHGILQDEDGFIWLATETGLSRFDGKHFRNFTTADGLPSNDVVGLYRDFSNRIWIMSFKNEACYYYNGKIHNAHNDPVLKKVKLGDFAKGCVETDDSAIALWDISQKINIIKGDSVIMRRVADSLPLLHTPFTGRQNHLDVVDFLVDRPKNYGKFIKSNKQFYYIYNGAYTTRVTIIHHIFAPGLAIFRDGAIVYEDNTSANDYIRIRNDSTIWIAQSPTGISIFDFIHKKEIASFLPGYKVYSILEDREGNLWFATRGYGLFKLSTPHVVSYELDPAQTPISVQWMQQKDGKYYISDDNGGLYQLYQSAPLNRWRAKRVKADLLWLKGDMEHKFINYNSSDFLDMQPNTGRSAIKSLFAFHDTVLIADHRGAHLCNIQDTKDLSPPDKINWIHKGRTTCGIKFGQYYFIGTPQGLYLYDNNFKLVNHFLNARISSFAVAGDALWIGTYENGVYQYVNGKLSSMLNQQISGLSSNSCRCLFVSGHYLWIGTDKGINKVDISGNSCKIVSKLTAADGLGSDIVNTIYVAEDSMVYVGTEKGLYGFRDDTKPANSFINLKLTDIIVSEKAMSLDTALLLQHKDNNIRFGFSGISFSGGDIVYQYRLLGLNEAWQVTREQSLSYPSLPSGDYTLEIRAINRLGIASPLLTKSFSIRQTLYERWWFNALIVLGLAGIIVALIYWRIRRVQNREEEKRKMNHKIMELEQMALRAQMNPHFIFNCLNSIQNYIVRQQTEGATFYLSKFADLVRQTLNNASRIHISLWEEINYISSYLELERMQMGSTFTYTIDVAPDINPLEPQIPNMVTQPYIENAIKHGLSRLKTGGLLQVRYRMLWEQQVLECSITDNGPGINFARDNDTRRNYKPKGMSITQERINMLNKMYGKANDIVVEIKDLGTIGDSQGTYVVIHFPLLTEPTQ